MDILVFGLTVVLLVVLIVACLLPVGADSPDDQGDGMTEVVIPRHVRTPRWRPRTLAFFAVTAAAISLPVRPFPARSPAVPREEPVAGPASGLFEGAQPDADWDGPDWDGPDWEDADWAPFEVVCEVKCIGSLPFGMPAGTPGPPMSEGPHNHGGGEHPA